MKNNPWLTLACLCAGLMPVSSLWAAQTINPQAALQFVDAADTVAFSALYSVSSPTGVESTGLGLRVHYNSSALDWVSSTPYTASLQPASAVMEDVDDFDHDTATDKYFILLWADLAATWPGGSLPLPLLESRFTVRAGFSGATSIRTSASATANNTTFQSTPMLVCAKPMVSLNTLSGKAVEGAAPAKVELALDSALPLGCGPVAVSLAYAGTATAGSDYAPLPQTVAVPAGSQRSEWPISALEDHQAEATEHLSISLLPGADYHQGAQAVANVSFYDLGALPIISLSANRLKIMEGSDNALLSVVRSGGDVSQALEVHLQYAGTASPGSDYQPLPASIIFPAGQTRLDLPVMLVDDSVQESNKGLQVLIQDDPAYQSGIIGGLSIQVLDDELSRNTSLLVGAAPVTPVQVPTLDGWALMGLSGLLGLFAAFRFRTQGGYGA